MVLSGVSECAFAGEALKVTPAQESPAPTGSQDTRGQTSSAPGAASQPRYIPGGSNNAPQPRGSGRSAPSFGSSAKPGTKAEQIAEIRRQLDEYENAVSELKKDKDGRLERHWPAGAGESGEYSKDEILKALDNARKGGPGGNGCRLDDCRKKVGGKWAPAVEAALKSGLKAMGSTCISGARSRADQERIKRENPGVGAAAIPGYSRHETCDALDVSGRYCPDGLIKLVNDSHADDNPTSHCSTTGG